MKDAFIAIIDDDTEVLASLKFAIETYGFQVKAYSLPALFLNDSLARPACLIVDHNMPSMTGIELVAELRQAENNVPILLTSGFVAPQLAEAATSLGIERVLQKPVRLADLLQFVRAYC